MEDTTVAALNRSDVTSPYFLHHSDNPSLVLVSKPLTGDNYASWHRAVSKSLNAKNKIGFVNGTIKSPSHDDNPEDYALWSRCNDMVHSWIINSLSPEISDSVIYYSTAREVWEDLRERFSQSNAPRIYEIQRDIAYPRQDQLSVSAYYTKLKGLWDELSSYSGSCQCAAQQDRQKLMQFLMGLNDSYSAVRGQILLMNPLPSIRQAYSSVSGEERQRNLAMTAPQSLDQSAAMAVRNDRGDRNGQNWDRGSQRQGTQGRSNNSDRDRNNQAQRRFSNSGGPSGGRPYCTHCDSMGHNIETCYQLHGFPPGHPKHKENRFRSRGIGRGGHQSLSANIITDGRSNADSKQ